MKKIIPSLTGFLFSVLAAAASEAHVHFDFLEHFARAEVTNAAAVEIRRSALAGGVARDALFEHPATPPTPARVRYHLTLPEASAEQKLFFTSHLAIADEVKWSAREDGVRFAVAINGAVPFSAIVRQSRWESHALDLTAWAGQHIEFDLLTDAIGNTSYDWALWGQPRILIVHGSATSADGQTTAPVPFGVVIAKINKVAQLKLQPDRGQPMEWKANDGWLTEDFKFPGAEQVKLSCSPSDALDSIWLSEYPPELKLAVQVERALVHNTETVPWHVHIRNQGAGLLRAGAASLQLKINGQPESWRRDVPKLEPDQEIDIPLVAESKAASGRVSLEALLNHGEQRQQARASFEAVDPVNALAPITLANDRMSLEFSGGKEGYAWAKVYFQAGQTKEWLATWTPLFQIMPAGASALQTHTRLESATPNKVVFQTEAKDQEGTLWVGTLQIELAPGASQAQLEYQWQVDQPRRVGSLLGPNIYVGDGTTGSAKSWALFPGLEFLQGPEPSSNARDFAPGLADRRTPHPNKVTIPIMAVTIGPDSLPPPKSSDRFFTPDAALDRETIAGLSVPPNAARLRQSETVTLSWDPLQRWDGQHSFPSPRFSSPNRDEGMNNHRMALFLPSCPDYVDENADQSKTGYPMEAGQKLTLFATLGVVQGPALAALRVWVEEHGGLPTPTPRPRSFQQSLDLCRAGFLKTLWHEQQQEWSHCIGWEPGPAPGFAALLWLDSQIAKNDSAKRASSERVRSATDVMMKKHGPGILVSQANCHIMQWEFPFLMGHLDQAWPAVDSMVDNLIHSQSTEGAWLFSPGKGPQAQLGREGDSVLGLSANRASTLLRYARITGDTNALAAGLRALTYMEKFRVPRGAQTWECPAYEPDILAAAYAVRAAHDAYRATGEGRWLQQAVYWAETGLPFVYLWTIPDKPMMLGATIPVFGSTFYTHTWLAVPVQWCGLVYAYHVLHLAEELQRQTQTELGAVRWPLGLNFKPADWKRLAELITVSATYQQFPEGDKVGAYPDSISQFEKRNPAFLNPEDILVNLLALEGYDPDIKTARVRTEAGEVVVSSGARINELRQEAKALTFRLDFYAHQTSHTLLSGFEPSQVEVNGKKVDSGWSWDDVRRRLYLSVHHSDPSAVVKLLAK